MSQSDQTWIDKWIDAVADGLATMSQRRLSPAERNSSGNRSCAGAWRSFAKPTDDQGVILVTASLHPFAPLC